jgi:hypothetical protein
MRNVAFVAIAAVLCSGVISGGAEPAKQNQAKVERHEGKLVALKSLAGNRLRLTVQEGSTKNDYSSNRRTLVYLTTPRNLALANQQGKLAQILKDSGEYRRSLHELSESQADAVMGVLSAAASERGKYAQAGLYQNTGERVQGKKEEKSERGAQSRTVNKNRGALGILTQTQKDFAEQEERRQERYGSPVRLKVGQEIILYTSATEDDTYLVLVVPKSSSSTAALTDRESAAKSSLALIRQLIADGKTDMAKHRLQLFLQKYEGTQSAKQAQDLLNTLP